MSANATDIAKIVDISNIIDVVVDEIKMESPYVKSFKFKPVNGSTLSRFSGGAHVTTYVENDKGDLFENHYSLTSDPDQTDFYTIAIRRSDESKGGSIYWHDHIKEGDQVKISRPKNHFTLGFSARHHIFIAAGIGITPFLSMAEDLKKSGKTFELHYAARSEDLCAFYPYLKDTYPDETNFYFSGEGNRMSPELMKNQPIGTHVYFCGPESMVNEYAEKAKSYGFPETNIHFELFSPPDFGPMEPFVVELSKSNQVIEVPEGVTLLDALLENGIDAPYSCKIGGCGTCAVDVVEGEVEHRDVFLTDKEKEEESIICTCISRAKNGNRLVLDL